MAAESQEKTVPVEDETELDCSGGRRNPTYTTAVMGAVPEVLLGATGVGKSRSLQENKSSNQKAGDRPGLGTCPPLSFQLGFPPAYYLRWVAIVET